MDQVQRIVLQVISLFAIVGWIIAGCMSYDHDFPELRGKLKHFCRSSLYIIACIVLYSLYGAIACMF